MVVDCWIERVVVGARSFVSLYVCQMTGRRARVGITRCATQSTVPGAWVRRRRRSAVPNGVECLGGPESGRVGRSIVSVSSVNERQQTCVPGGRAVQNERKRRGR